MRNPPVDAITQAARHNLGVIGKGVGCIASKPAAALIESKWQIPVIKRRQRSDAVSQQSVNQAVIKVQAALINRAGTLWQHTWPGDREAIRLQIERGHQRYI